MNFYTYSFEAVLKMTTASNERSEFRQRPAKTHSSSNAAFKHQDGTRPKLESLLLLF